MGLNPSWRNARLRPDGWPVKREMIGPELSGIATHPDELQAGLAIVVTEGCEYLAFISEYSNSAERVDDRLPKQHRMAFNMAGEYINLEKASEIWPLEIEHDG